MHSFPLPVVLPFWRTTILPKEMDGCSAVTDVETCPGSPQLLQLIIVGSCLTVVERYGYTKQHTFTFKLTKEGVK